MKLEALLKLKGQAAAKAFTELEHLSQYYLCMKVANKLDKKRKPPHVFKANIFDLKEDLPISYALMQTLDCVEDVSTDMIAEQIDDNCTLAQYIEWQFHNSFARLPVFPLAGEPNSGEYLPGDYSLEIAQTIYKLRRHVLDNNLEPTPINMTACSANFEWNFKLDGTNYILMVFFPDEEMEACNGDYEKLDWEAPYYQYTVD